MTTRVTDVMTPDPLTVTPRTSLGDAARLMRDYDVGDLLVVEEHRVQGIVTDRDIVVRAVADDCDPADTPVAEVCSDDPLTIDAGADLHEAVELMRSAAVRRLPVIENGEPVGIVSIGDLAMAADPDSALADISEAPGNL